MGSFNFKEKPYYRQEDIDFIRTSVNIKPQKNSYQFDKKMDIFQKFSTNRTKINDSSFFPFSCLGFLKIYHPLNRKVQIQGTCVLIMGNILLTCAHNIYNHQQKLFYKEIDYFPGQNGSLGKKITIKLTQKNYIIHPNYYTYRNKQHQHYDYGIIFLEQYLDSTYGVIKIQPNYKITAYDKLYLFGYSTIDNNIKNERFLYGSQGKLTDFKERILYYSMQTSSGQSGSPILIYANEQWRIVGIHTTSDPSGVYINTEVAKSLNNWINIRHSYLEIKDGSLILGQKPLKLEKMVTKYDWQNLVGIIFNKCNITSENLKNLNKLKWNVRQLNLNFNKIDEICLLPQNFKRLQRLQLDNNQVKYLPQSINSFEKLIQLSLRQNKLQNIEISLKNQKLRVILTGNKVEIKMNNNQSSQYIF